MCEHRRLNVELDLVRLVGDDGEPSHRRLDLRGECLDCGEILVFGEDAVALLSGRELRLPVGFAPAQREPSLRLAAYAPSRATECLA